MSRSGDAVQLSKEDKRADAEKRARLRKQSLPEGVFLVRLDRRVAALRVSAGAVEVQAERDGPWQPMEIAAAGRGGWLWSRAKLSLAGGTRKRVCVYHAGEQGLGDVGRSDQSTSGALVGGLGNDPISAVIAVLFLLVCVLATPFVLAAFVRHFRGAGRLIDAIAAR